MANKHEKLDYINDEAEYWDFSFPELAIYDLPAMIDIVYEEPGGRKIQYVGMSLGTT